MTGGAGGSGLRRGQLPAAACRPRGAPNGCRACCPTARPALCSSLSISTVRPPPPAPSALHRNVTPEKHPEADVAATFHPGLILNCAVFLSKLSGHLPPPGDRGQLPPPQTSKGGATKEWGAHRLSSALKEFLVQWGPVGGEADPVPWPGGGHAQDNQRHPGEVLPGAPLMGG